MQAYNSGYYRAYFKSLAGQGPQKIHFTSRVLSFDLEKDILASPCSEIVVDQISDAVSIGDACFVTNKSGEILLIGVIESISQNKISLGEALKFFDDEIFSYGGDYIECKLHEFPQKIFNIAFNGSIKSDVDSLEYREFEGLQYETINEKDAKIQRSYEPFDTINIYQTLKDLYSQRNLLVEFVPNLEYKENTYNKLISRYTGDDFVYKIIDNSIYTVNFTFEEEITNVNKLLVWKKTSDNYSVLVKKKFLTPNGLTEDDKDPTRMLKTKTKNVVVEQDASTDDINNAVNENIDNVLYMHQIEIEMYADNPLYDWRKMELGERYEVFADNKYYQTILTKIKFKKDSYADEMKIILTFGKSRTKLTDMVIIK